MAKAIVYLHHAAMTLRVEEERRGDDRQHAFASGWGLMKHIGDIALVEGRNEVDSDLWARWLETNKDHALVTTGAISEEKQDAEGPESGGRPAAPGAGES